MPSYVDVSRTQKFPEKSLDGCRHGRERIQVVMTSHCIALALIATATLSLAQTTAGAPQQDAGTRCKQLRSLTIPAAQIGLPTRGGKVSSATLKHSGDAEFCKVMGEITSVYPAAQPIRFEVNLPTQWNGKALQFGGGGFDGSLSVTNGLRMQEVGITREATPLQRGYATFGSDSGHHTHYLLLPDKFNEVRSSFAANLEQRKNYAHDGLKKTHDAAVYLMKQHDGSAPKRMFFIGGSTGGREAYFATQLWPLDYDGVLGAYAGWNQVQLDLQFIRLSQAEYRKGDKLTRGFLPKSKTKLVASKVMQACDALDGVRDGIISDPGSCHFDLKTLACPASQSHAGCLTAGELQTLEIFGSEQRTASPLDHGVQTIPGFNVTSGADLTGAMGALRHPFHPPIYFLNSFYYVIGDGVLRFFLTGDKHFDALTFDTTTGGKYAAELLPQSVASDASDADLTPFAKHGGKMLILHGTVDTTIPTGSTTEFYGMLQQKMGQAALDNFLRFYLIPGYGHSRGVFDAGFDGLGVLDRWVETGQAPENLTVVDNNVTQHGRSRPLCMYPAWPKYVSGDINLSASFVCAKQP